VSYPAAWQPDPTGKHDHRWWDGERWTEHVADAGQASVDPIEGATPAPPGGGTASPEAADTDAGGDTGTGGWVGAAGAAGAGNGGTEPGSSGLGGGSPSDAGAAGGTQPIWSQPGQQGGQAGGQQGGDQQGWQGGQQPGAQGWQGGQQPGWQGGPGQGQPWQGGTPTDAGGGQGWQQGGGPAWQQGGGGWQGDSSTATDGVAVAALIVGILAILVSWIPVLGAIGGIVALVLGLVGRSRIKKRGARGNGMAVTGIATGAVAIAINIAILAFFVIAGGDFFDEVSTYVECVEETGDEEECQRRLNEGLLQRFNP
jgi:hypothetical protein